MRTTQIIFLLLFFHNNVYSQINASGLNKPNEKDYFELIISEENSKLNKSIWISNIWISDVYDSQYDYNYGIIINKNKILDKINFSDKLDKRMLLRLIIAHEKMHARHYSLLEDSWRKRYQLAVIEEQLLQDEIKADMVAGYNAFEFDDFEYVKYLLKIIKGIVKDGEYFEPKFGNNEILFSKRMNESEKNALKLFFQLGENQNYSRHYPDSYQRMRALEIGMKASLLRSFTNYYKKNSTILSKSEKEGILMYIDILGKTIDYKNSKFLYESDYFYNEYIEEISMKIANLFKQYSKNIVFTAFDGLDTNDEGYFKFKSKITNNSRLDSLKFSYSILTAGKLINDDNPNFSIFGETHSMVILAPNETKIVQDSIFDISEILEDFTQLKLVFPGQHGSLYYTTKINKSTKKIEKKLEAQEYNEDEISIEDMIDTLHEIYNYIKNEDIENFIQGVGFKMLDNDYTTYNIFIKKRAFVMQIFTNQKTIFKTVLFSNSNLISTKDFMLNILKRVAANKKIRFKHFLDTNKYPSITLFNHSEQKIGSIEIKYDTIYNEFCVEIFLE